MVLDIAVKLIPEEPNSKHIHDLYTVYVDSKRILTVFTDDDDTATKWLKDVLKSTASNTKPMHPTAATFRSDSVYVGLLAETETIVYDRTGLRDDPYDLLTICVGSHCLMYELPYQDPPFSDVPKFVKTFFQNPRVVVLGTDMANVAKRLAARHGIEIKNPVDLNELAIKGLKRHDLDLGRYDLDRLAMVVLGKHFDVVRPEEKVEWRSSNRRCYYYDVDGPRGYYIYDDYPNYSNEKVKFTTVDTYLFLLIGLKLLEAIDGAGDSSSNMKKKKKKKINKRNL